MNKVSAEVSIEKDFYELYKLHDESETFPIFTMEKGLDATFDMFVSFGGDGTILRATTFVKDLGIPIVGVNTGRLGFLSTFKKEDVRKVVQEFKQGAYTVVERSLVQLNTKELDVE